MTLKLSKDTPQEWETPKTIWNKMFFGVFFATVGMNMGQQMSNSLLSLYAKSLGAPADQIGLLMSMFAITALICRFFAGPAMNAFNRKYLNIMAMCFMGTAYLGFSFSPTIAEYLNVPTVRVLQAFRLFQGLGNSFGSACLLTIVSDAIPKDKFASGMGFYACAQVVSQAIGPSVGVLMRDAIGYNMTYIVNACIMLTAILISVLSVRVAPRKPERFRLAFNNMIAKEALVPAGITFLVAMGFTSVNSFMLVYSEERGIMGASLFYTVNAVTLLLTRPLVGKLTDKYGFVKIGIPAVCLTACSLVIIGFSRSLPMLLMAALANACGYGACQPALQSLCMKSVPNERRGSASSTNFIGMDSATILGPMICGKIALAFGYVPLMWICMSIPVLLGALTIYLFRNAIKKIEINFEATNNNAGAPSKKTC